MQEVGVPHREYCKLQLPLQQTLRMRLPFEEPQTAARLLGRLLVLNAALTSMDSFKSLKRDTLPSVTLFVIQTVEVSPPPPYIGQRDRLDVVTFGAALLCDAL